MFKTAILANVEREWAESSKIVFKSPGHYTVFVRAYFFANAPKKKE